MTGKGEPQHSKSLQLSIKFCSLLLAASLSTVSHHHVRLSGLGNNPRQVKTPCTRYGFHDNSITFWCRITLFHRFGAKVKTSDTKRKKGQDKITREFDLLHLQESLSYASLRKGFFGRHAFSLIFSFSLKLPKVPFSSTSELRTISQSQVPQRCRFWEISGVKMETWLFSVWKIPFCTKWRVIPRPLVVCWYLVSNIPETDTPQTYSRV